MFILKITNSIHYMLRFLETLMHILKGNIGSGVFAMGDAFKNGGLILSPILTILLGVICVHSQHILVTIKLFFSNI